MRYLLVVSLLLALASSVTAATIQVPSDYTTIQAAVNAASPGDTILVAPGTYPEAVIVSKSVSIIGDPGDSAPGPGANAPVLDGAAFSGKSAFNISGGVSGVTISGFVIRNYGPDENTDADGIVVWSSTPVTNVVISDNRFTGIGWNAVLVGNEGQCVHSGWTVERNIVDDYCAYGLELTNCGSSTIKNNIVTGRPESWAGIMLCCYDYPGGSQYNVSVSGLVIEGNVVTGVKGPSGYPGVGIRLLAWDGDGGNSVSLSNVDILANVVSGCYYGVYVRDYEGASLTGVAVNDNSLVGNTMGLRNALAASLEGQNNWWGKDSGPGPVGPGTGDNVSSNVDYDPWLSKPGQNNVLYLVPTDESIYIQPGESILVDMNVANLQQKVNACQAMLGYSSTYFADPAGGCVQVPGSGPWDQVIWDSWKDSTGVPGEIDTAIGVNANGAVGTDADATICKITLTSKTGVEGATQMVFRPDVSDVESTFLSDMSANPVWPAKVNSTNIYIDGTAPVITCPADYTTSVATQSISASAADPVSGGVSSGVASFTMNGNPFTDPATVVLVPGTNTFEFRAEDRAGNVATKTLTITYNQPAPAITIVKSVAPNAFGGASYPGWQANSRYAVVNGLTSYGTGLEKFEAVTADQDYTVDMVTTFNSWLGILGTPGEYGNRLTYVYRIDNGVQTNPGAAKLNLNNVIVEMRNYWKGADSTPGDDYTDIWGYDWATRTDPAEFGAGNARLKGYNWVDGAWVEVVGGRLADMIIFDNAPGYANDDGAPATQATLNDLYKQLSGAVINRQYDPTPTKRQTLTKDEFEVKYVGHSGVGDADVTETTNYKSADITKPVIDITSPADGLKTNSASQTIAGTVTDDETLASGVREVKVFLNGSQVGSSYTTADPVNFSEAVTLVEGSNTIRVDAKDFAGNTESKTITVILDTVAPTINIDSAVQGGAELLISKGSTTPAVQGDVTITVSASDASPSSGLVTPPVVKVKDANNVETTLTASGSGPWTYTYTVGPGTANGIATITASIADEAGNVSIDTDTFAIDKNQITGTVSFSTLSTTGYGFTRDVVFVATDAGGAVLKTWTIPVSFTNAAQVASGSYTLTLVPGGTANLSAKTAWSLRKKQACALGGDGQAVSNFTLLGGDLNNTNSVNVLDYSILKVNWYPTNGAAADINGDGAVNTYDYSIMKSNWFVSGDAQ